MSRNKLILLRQRIKFKYAGRQEIGSDLYPNGELNNIHHNTAVDSVFHCSCSCHHANRASDLLDKRPMIEFELIEFEVSENFKYLMILSAELILLAMFAIPQIQDWRDDRRRNQKKLNLKGHK